MTDQILKQTIAIKTTVDIENRLYHAFDIYRRLPEQRLDFYQSPLASMVVNEPVLATKYNSTMSIIEPISARDITLADEVMINWWRNLELSIEDKELIQARCGAPLRDLYEHWSKIRSWKMLAYDLNMHRHTVKSHWDRAIKNILNQLPALLPKCA